MTNKKQNTEISKGIIAKAMDWAYTKAIGGLTGVDSAYELGDDFLKQKGTLEEQVDALIKWQVAKAATNGFVTGLGGITVLPLTLPVNIASVIYIQIRMITAIAYMGGHDIQEDRVKSMVYISMAGNGAKELLKEVTVKAGEKLVSKIIEKVSTHIAGKSTASLGKAVPLAGGIIGGSYDAISTRIVGKVAKKIFITTPPHHDDQDDIIHL